MNLNYLQSIVPKLVEGFGLTKGSMVLLNFWGENKDLDILDSFAIEIAKRGCIPLKWQYSQEFLKTYYESTPDNHLTFPDEFFHVFNNCNAVIDLCMYMPPTPHPEFPKEKISFYRDYMIKLMTVLSDKGTFIQVKVPTLLNAKALGVSDYEKFEDAMLKAMDIDYVALKEKTQYLANTLKSSSKAVITTGDNKVLTLDLTGRSWFEDNGNGDIPAGEVYIAPIENSANGEILIPQATVNGLEYTDLELSFKDGQLIYCSADGLMDMLNEIHPSANILAELGIGLNEQVTEYIGYAALDEKRLGTAHIALGMNSMFGGNNQCPVHFDFIFSPVSLEIDDMLIMKDGSLLL